MASHGPGFGKVGPNNDLLIQWVKSGEQEKLKQAIAAVVPGEQRALTRKIALIALGTGNADIASWAHDRLGLKGRVTTTEELGSKNFEQTKKWFLAVKNAHRIAFLRLTELQEDGWPSERDITKMTQQLADILLEFIENREELSYTSASAILIEKGTATLGTEFFSYLDQAHIEIYAAQTELSKDTPNRRTIMDHLSRAMEPLGLAIDTADQLCAEKEILFPGIGFIPVPPIQRAPSKWRAEEEPIASPSKAAAASSTTPAPPKEPWRDQAQSIITVLQGGESKADGSLTYTVEYADLFYDLEQSSSDEQVLDVLDQVVRKLSLDDTYTIVRWDREGIVHRFQAAQDKGLGELKAALDLLLRNLKEY